MLPEKLRRSLQLHLERVRQIHQHDLARNGGRFYLPFALEQKYRNANRSWPWQYVFPAAKVSTDPRSGERRRHHVAENNLQKAVKAAIERAGIRKAASCHTFQHSFATHFLDNEQDIRTVSGVTRPQGRIHHDDLHPCFKQTWPGRAQPIRPRTAGEEPAPELDRKFSS